MSTGIDELTTEKTKSEVLREIRSSLDAGFKFGDGILSSDLKSDEERTVLESARQTMSNGY